MIAGAHSTPTSNSQSAKYRSLFLADRDLDAFLTCLGTPQGGGGQAQWVRVRAAGGLPLLVRPGTTDARVIDDTFIGLYHLPPAPLPDHAVILDLGANAGYTAAHFAALYPHSRIIALELDGATAQAAQRTLAPLGPRVTLLHAAAWDHDGTVTYGGEEEWGFAASDTPMGIPAPGSRTAPAMTIDTLARRCNLDRIDFAKVDIEGGEARIITTEAPWLQMVRTLKVEVHPPAATMDGIAGALRAAGFAVRPDDRHWSCLIAER